MKEEHQVEEKNIRIKILNQKKREMFQLKLMQNNSKIEKYFNQKNRKKEIFQLKRKKYIQIRKMMRLFQPEQKEIFKLGNGKLRNGGRQNKRIK